MDLLLNWLWQGALVAVVAAVSLALSRRASARARYRVAAVALVAVLLLPIVSIFAAPTLNAGALLPQTTVAAPVLVSLPNDWWTSDRLVAALWTVWMLLTGAHAARGLAGLRRASRSCRAFPARLDAQLLQWRAVRGTGRAAPLVVCDAVRTAAVLGGVRPLIAVNPRLLHTLSADDLDSVVVHEWTHVQRRDDLAHFAQLAIRVVAGWHPAIWWLDRQLHFEREVACDERVVALTGSPRAYAGCLVTLASVPPPRARALPVVAVSSISHLRRRVTRILAFGSPCPPLARLAVSCAVILPLTAAIVVADVRIVGSMPLPLLDSVTILREFVRHADSPTPEAPSKISFDVAGAAREDRRAVSPAPAVVSAASEPVDALPAREERTGTADTVPPTSMPSLESVATWPLTSLRGSSTSVATRPPNARPGEAAEAPTIWDAAVTSGVAIGRGSQRAAVSTAGFFARVGKSIAGSF